MRSRIFLLALSLAVVFGGASALADEHDEETTPETNTGFVATTTLEDETTFIKYYVCSLDEEADDFCDTTLDEFDAESFAEWTGEFEVTPNEEGELNHGSYVSAFAEGYEGEGKGCLVRFIAQSDWGKEGSEVDSSELLIEAQTFCAFNGKPGGDEEVDGEDNGKPAWAGEGKPPWAGPDGDKSLKPGKGGDDD